MTKDGDIVFTIGADVAGLTRAGQTGEQSLADMERAAKRMESQLVAMGKTAMDFKGSVANLAKENRALYETLRDAGEAAKASQKHYNDLLSVNTSLAQSARDSAAAFEAFDKARAQVDSLKASIDPLFAASKRYEAALLQLDNALEMGAISAREHANMVDALAASYLRADAAADTMGGGLQFMGVSARETRGAVQNIGYQIQDFAVQVGAGTSATQAFAQQFPQMASMFGPWGAAIGTAAAVLIPLAGYFLSVSENADKLTEAMERQKTVSQGLAATLQALRLERDMMQSGAGTEAEQAAMNEIKRLALERVGLERELAQLHEQANANLGVINQKEVERVRAALQLNEENRKSNESMLASIKAERERVEKMQQAKILAEGLEVVMDSLADADITSPWRAVLGVMQAAVDKANEFRRASMVYSGRGGDPREFGALPGTSNTFDTENFTAPDASTGGGGGGGQDAMMAQLETLRQNLLTKEQLQRESYTREQEMLEQALEQQRITREQYDQMIQAASAKHAYEMVEIKRQEAAMVQSAQASMFGALSDLLGVFAGESKAAAIAQIALNKGLALAQIWQNTAVAQMRALAELGPVAGSAAAAKIGLMGRVQAGLVAATGLAQAGSVGGGRGGGGASGIGAAAASGGGMAEAPTQTMNFHITNDPFGFSDRVARQIVAGLNEATRNGSQLRFNVITT